MASRMLAGSMLKPYRAPMDRPERVSAPHCRLPTVPVGWARAPALVGYRDAVTAMEERAAAIARGQASELVWLVEHPPLYTSGPAARREHLVDPDRFEVHATRRGGQLTYHGPGQRVAYVMLDVGRRGRDVRAFVTALEAWVIETLAAFDVAGETRAGRVGVWVRRPGAGREDKIAAIGVQLKRWVSLHGLSINVRPDLGHYAGIVPCGIAEHGVTSLGDLGVPHSMEAVDKALRAAFERLFGPTFDAPDPRTTTRTQAQRSP